MKKFLTDLTEVGKDLWDGFVWIVEASCNAGELAGEKFGEITRKKVIKPKEMKMTKANEEVIRNCVSWQ